MSCGHLADLRWIATPSPKGTAWRVPPLPELKNPLKEKKAREALLAFVTHSARRNLN